jgi:hypothetical protein
MIDNVYFQPKPHARPPNPTAPTRYLSMTLIGSSTVVLDDTVLASDRELIVTIEPPRVTEIPLDVVT